MTQHHTCVESVCWNLYDSWSQTYGTFSQTDRKRTQKLVKIIHEKAKVMSFHPDMVLGIGYSKQ